MTAPRLFLGSLALLFVSTIGRIVTGSPATGYTLTAAEAVVLATCHDCANLDAANPFLAAVALAAEGQVPGGTLPAWTPERCLQYAPDMSAAAERHGVPLPMMIAVAIVESGCQGHPTSSSGAQGMFQIMPATGESIAKRHGITGSPYDPLVGIEMGAAYLGEQLRAFGSVDLAAAAYNGGPGAAACYGRGGRWNYGAGFCDTSAGAGLTAETRSYVRWVGGMYSERDQDTSATFEAWCNAGSGFGLEECS